MHTTVRYVCIPEEIRVPGLSFVNEKQQGCLSTPYIITILPLGARKNTEK